VSGYSTPRPISGEDDLAEFDSGEPNLGEWLRGRALTNQATGASRCFVTCRDGCVVGYYALATGSVQRIEASRRIGHQVFGGGNPVLGGRVETLPSLVVSGL